METKAAVENGLRLIALEQRVRQAWSQEERCKVCDRRMSPYDLIHGYCALCLDYVENFK